MFASGPAARHLVVRSQPVVKSTRNARRIHDITITRTGKPIFRQSGGRSSLGGHCVTVLGATGFLGRYIVNRLARSGCSVVIPYREEMAKRHLKVTGDLGRVTFLEFDLRNTDSIEESIRHSDVVINLIGREYSTKNFSFYDVHVDGVERIAEMVAKYDVDRFIHLSTYNADLESPSQFYKTKAESEIAARNIFPETTIVRPSKMYGFEDNFLHKHAGTTNLIVSNHLRERIYPVHVVDVGRALAAMVYDDTTAGQTFELYGPSAYTIAEIRQMVFDVTKRPHQHINIPKPIQKILRGILEIIWWPVTTPDDVEREFIDQKIDRTAKTFKDLGIDKIDDIQDKLLEYVRHYRSGAFYDLPPMTEKEKEEEKKYWHVHDDIYH